MWAVLCSIVLAATSFGAANPTTSLSSLNSEQAVAALHDSDVINFIQHANIAEIQSLKKSQNKIQSAKLKDLTQILIHDHETAQQQVATLANTLNITIPEFQAASNEIATDNILDQLQSVPFERALLSAERMDHTLVIQTLETMRRHTVNPQILKLINDTLPVLQKHLDLILAQ